MWVKITDKLPNLNRDIIIVHKDKNVCAEEAFIKYNSLNKNYPDGGFYFMTHRLDRYKDRITVSIDKISHWTYLPPTDAQLSYDI